MLLEWAKLVKVGPFEDLEIDFTEEAVVPVHEPEPPAEEADEREDGEDDEEKTLSLTASEMLDTPTRIRRMTVVHGDGGTGKSSLITAIGATRPGRTLPVTNLRRRGDASAHCMCDWQLAAEDGDRPHALRVASPNYRKSADERDEAETMRRREQSMFDRRAQDGSGFAFLEIPAQRYFGRSAVVLSDPLRTVLRYDVRASVSSDSSRLDLARPTKQVLAYAGISAAVAGDRRASGEDPRLLGAAMREAVSAAVRLGGHDYRGIEATTLEPMFVSPGGTPHLFDSLPTSLKHLVALVALPIRTLWASQRGTDPREAEGVVAIDDAELLLTPHLQAELPSLLRRACPRAQWILTTASPFLAAAADHGDLVTLRRGVDSDEVTLYEDELAVTH